MCSLILFKLFLKRILYKICYNVQNADTRWETEFRWNSPVSIIEADRTLSHSTFKIDCTCTRSYIPGLCLNAPEYYT